MFSFGFSLSLALNAMRFLGRKIIKSHYNRCSTILCILKTNIYTFTTRTSKHLNRTFNGWQSKIAGLWSRMRDDAIVFILMVWCFVFVHFGMATKPFKNVCIEIHFNNFSNEYNEYMAIAEQMCKMCNSKFYSSLFSVFYVTLDYFGYKNFVFLLFSAFISIYFAVRIWFVHWIWRWNT